MSRKNCYLKFVEVPLMPFLFYVCERFRKLSVRLLNQKLKNTSFVLRIRFDYNLLLHYVRQGSIVWSDLIHICTIGPVY